MNEQEKESFIKNSQLIDDTEDFFVWSHYQRRAGLPFDRESWQKARKNRLARYSVSGERDKTISSREYRS